LLLARAPSLPPSGVQQGARPLASATSTEGAGRSAWGIAPKVLGRSAWGIAPKVLGRSAYACTFGAQEGARARGRRVLAPLCLHQRCTRSAYALLGVALLAPCWTPSPKAKKGGKGGARAAGPPPRPCARPLAPSVLGVGASSCKICKANFTKHLLPAPPVLEADARVCALRKAHNLWCKVLGAQVQQVQA